MVRSMTGYGRAHASTEEYELTLEMRSVNHRYLDINVRMPRVYSFMEDIIKTALKEKLTRGKVDVFITVDVSMSDNISVTLNKPLLDGYINAIESMGAETKIPNDMTTSALMQLPDIFSVARTEDDTEKLSNAVKNLLDDALNEYMKMSVAEGRQLSEDISTRLNIIEDIVGKIEKRSPKCVEDYREKLEARMKEVLETVSIDPQRILTEAAIFADKISVSEETVRLRSHIRQLAGMLKTGGGIGRKLDFLVQELNREANTIGSKANDIETTQLVVEAKAEIEKIREQVQNIE